MSRRLLIVAVVVAVLLATMVAPAAATPPEAGDVASVQTEAGSVPNGSSLLLPLPIQLRGGGSCGGAGGCPN